MKKSTYIIDGHEFSGYKLGQVKITDQHGITHDLQAYFVSEDDDPLRMVVVDPEIIHFDCEERFLGRYGSMLTYLLVWSVKDADKVTELVAWFPRYEKWGL